MKRRTKIREALAGSGFYERMVANAAMSMLSLLRERVPAKRVRETLEELMLHPVAIGALRQDMRTIKLTKAEATDIWRKKIDRLVRGYEDALKASKNKQFVFIRLGD